MHTVLTEIELSWFGAIIPRLTGAGNGTGRGLGKEIRLHALRLLDDEPSAAKNATSN